MDAHWGLHCSWLSAKTKNSVIGESAQSEGAVQVPRHSQGGVRNLVKNHPEAQSGSQGNKWLEACRRRSMSEEGINTGEGHRGTRYGGGKYGVGGK